MFARLSTLTAVTALALAIGALPARAEEPVKGEVLVVLAKEPAGPIDPKLKAIAALQKPPFNGFGTMELIATNAVTLTDTTPATVALPNGRSLQIKLVERMPDGRHKVSVSINRPDKQDYLPLLTVIASGEPFFVAGQKHAGGTLVIGVQIGGKSAGK
jgi:hypothetical protein